jgi:hypothetical protein
LHAVLSSPNVYHSGTNNAGMQTFPINHSISTVAQFFASYKQQS